MAPGKKKKKPASNPSRGFATTSTISKSKLEREADSAESSAPAVKEPDEVAPIVTSHWSQNEPQPITQDDRRGTTPEEFEQQLEESQLQALLENHAQKSKKERARQISRLQTDRRLLRGQAGSLNTRQWLPVEQLSEILEILREESCITNLIADVPQSVKFKRVSEDDEIIRLWTLQQILLEVGFHESSVQKCLEHILKNGPASSAAKESVWGLDEALEWLSLELDRTELPGYEALASRPEPTGPSALMHVDLHDELGLESDLSIPNAEPLDTSSSSTANDFGEISDLESDIEPGELLTKYLSTKLQLYEMSPASVASIKTQKGKSSKKPTRSAGSTDPPHILKLKQKLQKIESDALFDQREADQIWIRKKVEADRENARQRKEMHESQASNLRMGPDNHRDAEESQNSFVAEEVSYDAAELGEELMQENEEDEDGEGILGGIFASLPQSDVDPATGATRMILESPDGAHMLIRDFGTWAGVSPRRILEEACRGRDPGVRFTYKVISSASFSNRQSLTIQWSKDQGVVQASPVASLTSASNSRTAYLSMLSISTPEANQSEALISTAALFLIFSVSTRDEKIHLRLPPVWRDYWLELAEAKKDITDRADRETLRKLRKLVQDKRDAEEEEGVILTNGFRKRNINGSGRVTPNEGARTPLGTEVSPDYLKELWRRKSTTNAYQTMLRGRMKLPIWSFREEVAQAIDRHQVVIICGETGCGKSTQVPSFVLEWQLSQGKSCKIYCTEPRRISAISLARRVSDELGERKQDIGTSRSMVGYAIRLEANMTRETRIVYATTGIVMRMLEGSGDLEEITHLIIDEVHERSIDSDFLLIVLRKLMLKRADLKVILMSATVDAQRFSKYLDNAPVLNVPGRTFPVTTKYLEDAIEVSGYKLDDGCGQTMENLHLDDLDAEVDTSHDDPKAKKDALNSLKGYSTRTRKTLSLFDEYRIDFDFVSLLLQTIATDQKYAQYSKAILVFLPGIAEIRQMNDMLCGHPAFSSGWYIYPLHSSIASEEQEAAFLIPPEGVRKIVLATNIAETGVTIPDITAVVDCGKHKEMRFDERRQLSRLIESFISRANAKQRRGRAGRVRGGICFHLFTKTRHDQILAEQQTPEMLRLSLQDLVLRVKICKLGEIEETLLEALDPPSAKNIRRAIDSLVDVKALTTGEELTALGRQLAKLPLDVHLGKLILLGCTFNCLDVTITIAAILSSKSPFQAPLGARKQADLARLSFKRGDSDLLTVWNAYSAWRRVCSTPGQSEMQFCRKNFLSPQTLSNIEDLKSQLLVAITDAGFVALGDAERQALQRARFNNSRHRNFISLPQAVNLNSDNDLIAASIIAAAFYPKLLVRDGKGWRNVANNQSVSLHPTSVNKGSSTPKYLSYYHIMQSSNRFYNAHETSLANDFAIALLCGEAQFHMYAGVVVLDGNRLRFKLEEWKTLLAIKALRTRLREIMVKGWKSPGKPLSERQKKWLEIWRRCFERVWLAQEKKRESAARV